MPPSCITGPDATTPLTYSGRFRYTWAAVIVPPSHYHGSCPSHPPLSRALPSPGISSTPAYLRSSEPIPYPCAPHQTHVGSYSHARFRSLRGSVLSLLARLGPSQSRNVERSPISATMSLLPKAGVGEVEDELEPRHSPRKCSPAPGWTCVTPSRRWLCKRIGRNRWQKLGKSRSLTPLTSL